MLHWIQHVKIKESKFCGASTSWWFKSRRQYNHDVCCSLADFNFNSGPPVLASSLSFFFFYTQLPLHISAAVAAFNVNLLCVYFYLLVIFS